MNVKPLKRLESNLLFPGVVTRLKPGVNERRIEFESNYRAAMIQANE